MASLKVAGVTVTDATYVPDWEGPWETSTPYTINDLVSEAGSTYICLVAHTSGTFSSDLTSNYWDLFAQQGSAGAGTGDMLAANNLSDVTNVATSRGNLDLGTAATTASTDYATAAQGTLADSALQSLSQATETTVGGAELATQAEAEAGSDDLAMMTALKTKQAVDNLSPISAKSFVSTAQVPTDGARISVAHGLGTVPLIISLSVVCTTTEGGWSVGETMMINPASNETSDASGTKGLATMFDSTNVYLQMGDDGLRLVSSTGGKFTLDSSKWNLYIRAWA
ncbi:MAG: hypothetical protein GQ574_14590 [Crocinitomix sp.]|nr:hypothetical protein [Crocinitomix sp.]